MRPVLDFNALKIFIAVVERDSFVGASKALEMPTSNVSRCISQLLFGQRRTSQFSYCNISAHNVYYVKCNVVLNNVIFDSCLFPHQHYDRHSFHARECCAIRQNV